MTRTPQHSAPKRPRPRSRFRVYDLVVVPTLLIGYVEIGFWGARPASLGWLLSIMASPAILRYDEARRGEGD